MLHNYLKIALRTLRRHTGYAFINVFGLAVGMACCLLILLYVRDELRYDRYHEHADRIHRLIRQGSALSAGPMGPALATEMPGVETAARIETNDVLVHDGAEQRFEERLFLADSSLFDIFSFPFIQGNPETALTRPNALVLTASAARKYFGDADPIGKTLIVEEDGDQVPLTVTGVLEDLPRHSHFRFDLLASFKLVEQTSNRIDNWNTNWLFTYFLVSEGTTAEEIQAKLPAFFERHTGEAWTIFRVQPLLDAHLHSAGLEYDIAPQGSIAYVYIFSAIALLVLLVACINFMNLATARASRRALEVGMRKVLGAQRAQLIGQFLGESLLLAGGALVLAAGLVALLLPGFGHLAEKDLALTAGDAGFVLLAFVGVTLLVGLLAGSYPAFFLSAFRPIETLKEQHVKGARGVLLRKGLVVFQFAVSIFLIVGTLVVTRQLDYVKNTRLGFEKAQVVVLPFDDLDDRYETVKQEVLKQPGVRSVAASGDVPGRSVSDFMYRPEGLAEGDDDLPGWDTYFVDADFVETLEIDMAAGRDFSKDLATDESAFLLNETAVEAAREAAGALWQNPVGRQLDFYVPGAEGWRVYKSGTVIGVVENFHYRSLREEIGPLVLQVLPGAFSELLVKVDTDDLAGTLAALEATWHELGPNRPFDYVFLDKDFDRLYRAEERVGQLFGTFAGLAIVIACLGLFGLAAFTAEQRTKEIGIRKVLGASIPSIVALLSKDFARLVVIAFVVATPLAYVAMNRWLADFAYRIDVAWWMFLIAGLAAIVIAGSTISYQSIKAALADPVQSLRYE